MLALQQHITNTKQSLCTPMHLPKTDKSFNLALRIYSHYVQSYLTQRRRKA